MDAMRAHTGTDGVTPSQEQSAPTRDRTTGPTLEQIRAAQRDPQAAASIYATWFEPVYLYCLRRLDSPQAAEDATSRIFERVLTALPDYQPNEHRTGATFRSWLFAIAHNTIVDLHRRRRFHLSLDQLLRPFRDRPPIELPSTDRPPLDQVIDRETDRAVRDALGHLPARQRRIVELRLAGLTGPEIATALDITTSAVKSAQFRAYVTLREVLTVLGYAPDLPEDDHASS